MCEHPDIEYLEFPARIIGGPTGDYYIQCDVTSCQWAEYIITGISNGAAAAATVVVSGNSAPKALKYDGTVTTINNDNCPSGNSFSVVASTTIPAPMVLWERITHSQKRVFVRIDAGSNNSCYVNIRFRVAVLKRIPGPSVTVHPDHAHQLNIARADAIRERTALQKEIGKGENLNARR